MNAGLRFSKLQSPRICNNCAHVAKYEITAGTHNLLLCYDCAHELMLMMRVMTEQKTEAVNTEHMKEVSHDNIGTEN